MYFSKLLHFFLSSLTTIVYFRFRNNQSILVEIQSELLLSISKIPCFLFSISPNVLSRHEWEEQSAYCSICSCDKLINISFEDYSILSSIWKRFEQMYSKLDDINSRCAYFDAWTQFMSHAHFGDLDLEHCNIAIFFESLRSFDRKLRISAR